MNDKNKIPRLPEIGEFVRGVGTLIEFHQPERPPTPPKDWIFEVLHGRAELWHGDEKIDDLFTYWDHKGLGSSFKSAIEDAKEYAVNKDIGPDSPLEVKVFKEIHRRRINPIIKDPAFNYNFYDRAFFPFEECGSDISEVDELVWSSRKPETENLKRETGP